MMEFYTVSKSMTRSIRGSDHELLIAKFNLKWKKVGETPRPFRYQLSQFSHSVMSDYL